MTSASDKCVYVQLYIVDEHDYSSFMILYINK